jgi:homoserine kinase
MNGPVSVFAPASISNVACGFDVFGFAINGPGDIVTARINESFSGVKITKISGDEGRLPYDAKRNTAGIAVRKLLKMVGSDAGIELEIEKKMPFASGLGSSAASAAAAVKAVNELLNLNLDGRRLLPCVIESEKSISGTAHADNAAPALLGGFVLVRSVIPVDIVSLPLPAKLHFSVIHPNVEISTNEARQALPIIIPLTMAVKHWGNTASLVHAMHTEDFDLLARSMEDLFAEPVRSQWIPFYNKVKENALKAGAIACNISGSGPSIFAFSDSEEKAMKIAEVMKAVYDKKNIKCSPFWGKVRREGAVILK